MTRPAPPSSAPAPPRPRRWRRLILLLLLLGCLYLGRAPLLRGLATLLIVDHRNVPSASLVLLGGEGGYAEAADWYHRRRTRQVLLLGERPGRLEKLGVIPPPAELDRQALRAEGLPDSAILLIAGRARDDWQRVRLLGGWMRDHPGADVLLLCNRFGSRRLHLICRQVLGPDANRAHLLALPAREYDETTWWQHKEGLLDFLGSALGLAYCWAAGERTAPWHDWSPEDYKAGLP